MKYLGHLHHADPFYKFLKERIWPQIDKNSNVHFSVHVLRGSNQVFLYTNENSGVSVIGKFFYGSFERAYSVAAGYLTKELKSLEYFREIGFDKLPFYVPKPLGASYDINCVLVEEYCPGTTFSDILKATAHGHPSRLYRKLSILAEFLAKLHNKTAIASERVNFNEERHYSSMLVNHLRKKNLVGDHEAACFYHLIEKWAEKEIMWEDNRVLVHGDATPANFLFRNHTEIIAIDLEKSHYSDRLFDVGRVAGEIKHAFLLEKKNAYISEPFIGHFLWQYCTYFPNRFEAFQSITRRLPFYLAINMLRIARNPWVSSEHRKKLLDQAFLNFHYKG